ncbi:hypothetical protein Btru_072415 [Bulinus truncatus]|nr:hypothetical protein Btru_072415 [Bulinus truncatus]
MPFGHHDGVSVQDSSLPVLHEAGMFKGCIMAYPTFLPELERRHVNLKRQEGLSILPVSVECGQGGGEDGGGPGAGHTHGGQMFPMMIGAYLLTPFVADLYQYGPNGSHVYVSQGTQYWGIPMRLGTTLEITSITLRSTKT